MIGGRVWKFGDNINTDLMLPGPYLFRSEAEQARAVFQANRPGWVDEVRGLNASVPADAPAWNATGYGAVRELVRGEATVDETADRVTIATRQYAKRQRTWFRHQLPPAATVQLDPDAPDATARAEDWMAA